ncbi:MAG: class I SAM-dependent methyltransferase [Oscillospiraceae bacterium]|jgi:SAM-dependent methyltransferase|nr:class I SAM-dependent methyltransferase [Oscillospiraceae bacterium]
MDNVSFDNNEATALFENAEKLYRDGNLTQAADIYMRLEKITRIRGLCLYRLAAIANASGDPATAYDLYYAALKHDPELFRNNNIANYFFGGKKEEVEIKACPLCGKSGEPYWCYTMVEAASYKPFFNPVRLWKRCAGCNHLYADSFPKTENIYKGEHVWEPNRVRLSMYSDVIWEIRRYTKGLKLLEVGLGGCECILAARETGYDVFGVDIMESYVKNARDKYGLNVEVCDFTSFETNEKYDVIIMGDVIEHVFEPAVMISKANELLNAGGVLWISTPNYQSAFTTIAGHRDPMRWEASHVNYFSRESLYSLLGRFGFEPVSYRISKYYNGSMEVIALKVAV